MSLKSGCKHARHSFPVLVFVAAISLGACGNDEEAIPVDGKIVIDPQNKTWEIPTRPSPCPYDPNLWIDERVLVTVRNGDEVPLGNVEVAISADLTAAYTSGLQESLQLYVDVNGNNIVDTPPDVLVSGNGSPAWVTDTDEYTGAVSVLLRVNVSCPFRGNIIVTAGPLYGSTNIEVSDGSSAAP